MPEDSQKEPLNDVPEAIDLDNPEDREKIHPMERYKGDLKQIEYEGEDLIAMALWYSAYDVHDKAGIAYYHVAIVFSLLGKTVIMALIQDGLEKVNCDNFVAHNWEILLAKALAVTFMTVKILSLGPKVWTLRFSAEYKMVGKRGPFGFRFPFGLYLFWCIILDFYIAWVAVTIALAETELLIVFAKFAAILIFSDSELILGTFAA